MTTITTKLIRDGNSAAVRLPKTVLAMSGLRDDIQMEVKRGQITLRSSQKKRTGWEKKITTVLSKNPNIVLNDNELNDWDATTGDGLY